MKQIILDSPKQLKIGIEKATGIGIKSNFDNIVICGLGGSAMPAVLLIDFIPNLKIPVYTHRAYGLPNGANKKSLIVCISFSGNTEETLSAYNEAVEKGYNVIALTTGGELKRIAKEKGLPCCVVPNDCTQPRFGTGYLFASLIKILENSGILENKSKEIIALASELNPASFESEGKALATKLVDKIPVVYASEQYKSIARINKIKFNENSKIMAFWNYFPELNHNEMVGLTNLKGNFYFLILKDNNDNPKNIKRMDLFSQLAKEKGAGVDIIEMQGETKLKKMFNALLLFDWISYYLALAYNVDPIAVKIVEDFKKQLKQ